MSVEHLALLMRAMRFSEVSATESSLVRFPCPCPSSLPAWARDTGPWWPEPSRYAGHVGGRLERCRWIPGLPRRDDRTIPALRFAIYTYGCFTVGYFMRNMDSLLIGWRFGPQVLGLYKKAFDLFTIPVEVSALSHAWPCRLSVV